ncbi:MAG: glycosyltransferase [Saprospiraceae bacterium]
MKILIAHSERIPATHYGGTERVVWSLGKALRELGHEPVFLLPPGSSCPFAPVLHPDPHRPLADQIPPDVELAHFHYPAPEIEQSKLPTVFTIHGNVNDGGFLPRNSIFVSRDHAMRHGAEAYVHNGLDWSAYPPPRLKGRRMWYHFLGKAAWRVKNVKGAIDLVRRLPGEKLYVLGGNRLNISMGFRFTLTRRARFFGKVDDATKGRLLDSSKGLIFPVRWHEPFGLAIIESLYYGCPVFGTPYGSLPELVGPELGYLSASLSELSRAAAQAGQYAPWVCHEYARERFSARVMAAAYLRYYAEALAGRPLNARTPSPLSPATPRFLPWIDN